MPPNQGLSPQSIVDLLDDGNADDTPEFPSNPSVSDERVNEADNGNEGLIRVAVLGCGMMGQVGDTAIWRYGQLNC